MCVFVLATLDTKGHEAEFLRERLIQLGQEVTIVDTGCLGSPSITAEISREKVFAAAGTTLPSVQERRDRGEAITFAAQGATKIIQEAFSQGKITGVLGIGGSAGTTIATTAMRALPIGLPKLMVSTMASGQVRPYVGDKDILMLNSVVDILGINRISRLVLGEAAAGITGMINHRLEASGDDKPLVGATMFGVTTPCVVRAREVLEEAGYEVLVFHATGNGGQAMESLIREGMISGVLDITTTELADELVGGILSAGPERLTAAAKSGVPQVVSVGATDMVNFGPVDSVPETFSGRVFYEHNSTVTLMRTTAAENAQLGKQIGTLVAQSTAPAAIMLPLQGVSAIDCQGQPFNDPQARESLFNAIRKNHGNAELIELDYHINDPEFAEAAARKLLEMMKMTTAGR